MKERAIERGAIFGKELREMEQAANNTRNLQFDQNVEQLRSVSFRSHEHLESLLVGIHASLEYMIECIDEGGGRLFRKEYREYCKGARIGKYQMPPAMLLDLIIVPCMKELYVLIKGHITMLKVATTADFFAIFCDKQRDTAFLNHTSGAMRSYMDEALASAQQRAQPNRGGKARRLEGGAYSYDNVDQPQQWQPTPKRNNNGGKGKGEGARNNGGKGNGGRNNGGKKPASVDASRKSIKHPTEVTDFAREVTERLGKGVPAKQRYCGYLNVKGSCPFGNECIYLHETAPWLKKKN